MAKSVLVIVLILLMAVSGAYYYCLYPPMLLQRATQHALEDFSKTVETKDRAKISVVLKNLLTDSATIHLEISFFSLIQANAPAPMVQEFDKAGFITFLDNILYSLSDYSYTAQVQHFQLSPDRKTADIIFTSKEWGDGTSEYSGTVVNMRFSSETTCEGKVVFEGKNVLLDKAVCKMHLRSVPKPGEERKLMEPEALRQYLR